MSSRAGRAARPTSDRSNTCVRCIPERDRQAHVVSIASARREEREPAGESTRTHSSMLRFIGLLALSATLATAQQEDRGRPVILLLHGRGMVDHDSADTRKLWLDGLTSGSKRLAKGELVTSRDVRLVWYADVLDPRSGAGCAYDANDARARRD